MSRLVFTVWLYPAAAAGRPARSPLALLSLFFHTQIGEEDIEALYHYAKFQFECGNYTGASEFLRYYRSLCTSAERSVSALWGKFAADILMQEWDEAQEDMTRLKELIDSKMGDGSGLTRRGCTERCRVERRGIRETDERRA